MRTRAQRRTTKEFLKVTARRIARQLSGRPNPELEHHFACNCDNLKMCGSPCCQNPRRNGWTKNKGKTRGEILIEDRLRGKVE
ncbi:MAG: hypothetical protein V4719_14875 [Planctomycetota bacterium]